MSDVNVVTCAGALMFGFGVGVIIGTYLDRRGVATTLIRTLRDHPAVLKRLADELRFADNPLDWRWERNDDRRNS